MSADVQKMLKVTFADGLPLGTRGTFSYEGELWIAYPQKKNQRIFTVTDKLCGIFVDIHKQMLRWINDWPSDAQRVTEVMERVGRARELYAEITLEKAEAHTS